MWSAIFTGHQGDHDEAIEAATRDLTDAFTNDDPVAEAHAHVALAAVLGPSGDYNAAQSHASAALTSAESAGDIQLAAMAQMILGEAKGEAGDIAGSLTDLESALANSRIINDPWIEIEVLESMGLANLKLGSVSAQQSGAGCLAKEIAPSALSRGGMATAWGKLSHR